MAPAYESRNIGSIARRAPSLGAASGTGSVSGVWRGGKVTHAMIS
jgi:hypothetical protein